MKEEELTSSKGRGEDQSEEASFPVPLLCFECRKTCTFRVNMGIENAFRECSLLELIFGKSI